EGRWRRRVFGPAHARSVSARPKTLAALLCTLDVLACLVAGAVAASAAEQRIPATRYRGVNSHAPWYWQVSKAEVKREIAQAAALGLNYIRIPVEWAGIESRGKGVRGGEALRRLDLIVREAAADGIKIDGTIATTPHWASPGGGGYDAPSHPESSLRPFAKWLAKRYGAKLIALGVWNEPTKSDNLKSPSGTQLSNKTEAGLKQRASYYAPMVKAVFNGAREGNASLKVLAHEDGAEVGQSVAPLTFLRACFSYGMRGYFDAIAVHAYSEGAAPEVPYVNSSKSKIERLHRVLKEEGSSAPIWASEWGYSLEDSEAVRAEYVKKGVQMLDTQLPYLEGWSYFLLRDTVNAPAEKEENFGLLEQSFTPRRSLTALQGMLRASVAIKGARALGPRRPPSSR